MKLFGKGLLLGCRNLDQHGSLRGTMFAWCLLAGKWVTSSHPGLQLFSFIISSGSLTWLEGSVYVMVYFLWGVSELLPLLESFTSVGSCKQDNLCWLCLFQYNFLKCVKLCLADNIIFRETPAEPSVKDWLCVTKIIQFLGVGGTGRG